MAGSVYRRKLLVGGDVPTIPGAFGRTAITVRNVNRLPAGGRFIVGGHIVAAATVAEIAVAIVLRIVSHLVCFRSVRREKFP